MNADEAVCCGGKSDIAVDNDAAVPMVGKGGASGDFVSV